MSQYGSIAQNCIKVGVQSQSTHKDPLGCDTILLSVSVLSLGCYTSDRHFCNSEYARVCAPLRTTSVPGRASVWAGTRHRLKSLRFAFGSFLKNSMVLFPILVIGKWCHVGICSRDKPAHTTLFPTTTVADSRLRWYCGYE